MREDGIRPGELERWLREKGAVPAGSPLVCEPLRGDVSLRRYYRVHTAAGSAILAYYPPEIAEVARRFARTTAILTAAGVRVPAVRRFDAAAGLMLLEDVGALTLFDWRERPWTELSPWLAGAVAVARRVQRLDPRVLDGLLPPLDEEALRRELEQTWDLFLAPQGLTGGAALRRRLRARLDAICSELAAEGLAPGHRDFMARNLVPLAPSGELAVLDHQDLRLAPPSYDLASLFNDSLFPPEAEVRRLLGEATWASAGYHRAVVQRTLKVVGTFAAFAQRGQPRYLPLVPRSLARCLEHLAALPGDASLAAELRHAWAPAL